MKKTIFAIIIIVIAAAFGIYYSTRSNDIAPIEEQNQNTEVKEFTVTGENFKFSPTEITVNRGERVRLTFRSVGGTHDWRLDEFNAATNVLPANQEQTIEFTADQSGTFEYYCSVGNHRAMGMVGNFTVI